MEQTPLQREVAALLVEALKLKVKPDTIEPEQALFGNEGLGLDSIDALELSYAISQRYGFEIHADSEDNVKIFSSLAALSQHVADNKVK